MAGLLGYRSLPPKAKNLVVVGGLTTFVFGAYFYTMRVVGGTDELQDFDVITSAELKERTFSWCEIVGKRFPVCHVHMDHTIVEVGYSC
ncbi:hypothetical protein JHK85_048808 [Glycine max]|uniref:Uncharacterized protein n=1 Tax=Glycine max TaxID=3847 RepID=A0A0R0FRZ5_SOYBN|nr:hypothetical protein JHK86_048178 [Glycine max]KAG4944162.1 hypothetical protein JHK85_048808 [Glycine max]